MKRALLLLAFVPSLAVADDKSKADSLFKQGKKLMGEKKYAEACEAFEKSQALDPGIGTQLNIAKCYEDWGKLSRALKAYRAADKMATDAKDTRADKIEGLITELDPQVPRLTIHVPKGAKTDGVTIDGAPAGDLSAAIMLDPGPHTIVYPTADGHKTKTKVVPVERGGSSEITLELPAAETTVVEKQPPPPPPPPPVQPSDPGRGYKLAAYGVGGAGIVAIGVSSYLTLSARSKYNDALKAHCGGVTNGCDDVGLEATHDARHQANLATVVFSVGLAAVGGGVALYLLAPKHHAEHADEASLYVVPSVTPEGGGLVLGGGF